MENVKDSQIIWGYWRGVPCLDKDCMALLRGYLREYSKCFILRWWGLTSTYTSYPKPLKYIDIPATSRCDGTHPSFSGTIPLLIFSFISLSCLSHLLSMGEQNLKFFLFFSLFSTKASSRNRSGDIWNLPPSSQPYPWCQAAKVFMDNLPNWTCAKCFSGSPFPPASSESLARSNPVPMPGRNSGALEGERLQVHWTQWPTLGKSSGERNGGGGSIHPHGRCGTASREF